MIFAEVVLPGLRSRSTVDRDEDIDWISFRGAVGFDLSFEIDAAAGAEITLTTQDGVNLFGSITESHEADQTINAPIRLGNSVVQFSTQWTTGDLIFNGAVNLNGNQLLVIPNRWGCSPQPCREGGQITINSRIEGTGELEVGHTGSDSRGGVLTLTASNTYDGATLITRRAKLRLQGGGRLPDTDLTVSQTGELIMNGMTDSVRSLNGGGRVSLQNNAALVVGNNGNAFGSGMFSGQITGTGSLEKRGSATLTLLGDNSHSGGTNVVGGTLLVSDNGRLRDGNVDVRAGATLTLDGGTITTPDFDVDAGATFDFQSGTLNIGGGASRLFGGPLVIGSDGSGVMTMTPSSGDHAFSTIKVNDTDDSLTFSGATTAVEFIDNSNGGSFNMSGAMLNLTDSEQGITTGFQNDTIGGTLTGVGGVTKVGPGTLTWTLGNGSTFSGPTHVESGTILVTGRISDASLITVDAGATLRWNTGSADAVFGLNGHGDVDLIDTFLVMGNFGGPAEHGGVGTFHGTLTGDNTSGFEKRGTGTFTLAGTARYGGLTEIENGEVVLTGSLSGTSRVDIIDGTLAEAGTLSIDGGSLTTSGATTIRAGGTLNLAGGELNTNTLDFSAPDGGFNFTGGALNADAVLGDLVNNGGNIVPGDSAGVTAINGSLTINAGLLEIEVGGLAQGVEFDFVDVNGAAALGGDLVIGLIDGYIPEQVDAFIVLSATSLTGAFGNVANGTRLDTLGGEGSFLVNYDTANRAVVLSDFFGNVLETLGDTNGDGQVNIDDLNNVRNNFGTTGPDDGTLAGDSYPFDGLVNIDDLNGVRNNFGAGAAAVPEPSTVALASVLCLVALIVRPRRRT